jgi:hypothetical protein
MSGGRTIHPAIQPCPSCGLMLHSRGEPFTPPRVLPDTGDPGLCTSCGTLVVWTGAGWRVPDEAEREALLGCDAVTSAMMMHREWLAWRDADRSRLVDIVSLHLSIFGMAGSRVAADLVLSIEAAGFHTTRLAEL